MAFMGFAFFLTTLIFDLSFTFFTFFAMHHHLPFPIQVMQPLQDAAGFDPLFAQNDLPDYVNDADVDSFMA